MEIELRGQTFELLPEKCLFWRAEKLLVVADLHLGKAEAFQYQGLWLPPQAQLDDLKTLLKIAAEKKAQKILFLGDLIHSLSGVTREVIDTFKTWLDAFQGEVLMAIGNHDLPLMKNWPQAWERVKRVDQEVIGSFIFQHEPPESPEPDHFYWIGHIHPNVVIKAGPDRMRLPSFVMGDNIGMLPAYSSLAGGFNIQPRAGQRIYPVAAEKVFEL
jgi:DNA ligase-associated metallophosphoesterase